MLTGFFCLTSCRQHLCFPRRWPWGSYIIIQHTRLFHFLMVWPPDHSPYPCLHIRFVGVVSRRAREAIQTYQISPSRRPPAGMSGDRTSLEIIVNWCNCRLMRRCLFLHTPLREPHSNMFVYWIDYLPSEYSMKPFGCSPLFVAYPHESGC